MNGRVLRPGALQWMPAVQHVFKEQRSMTDSQIQARATIAAALIQSRSIDAETLGSLNKDISNHKLAHLRELTDRIYNALAKESAP
jgi:hypothetical protein